MKTFSNRNPQYPYNKSDLIPLKFVVFLVKHRKSRWIIQICATIFHIFLFVFPSIDKNETFYAKMQVSETSLKCIDFLEFSLIVFTNVFCFVVIQNNTVLFSAIFFLRNKLGNAKINKNVSSGILVAQLLVIPFNIGLICYQFESSSVKYPIAAALEYWCFTLTMGIASSIIYYMKGIIENFNNFLESKMLIHFHNKRPGHVILKDLSFITKHHNNICNVLDTLNGRLKAFLAMLLLSINVIVLWAVGLMILVGLRLNGNANSQTPIFIVCTISSLIVMVSIFSMW